MELSYQNHPEYFRFDEREMERELKRLNSPMTLLSRYRINFWNEYNDAQDRGRQMLQANVIKGCGFKEQWRERIENNVPHLAYVILPPTDYVVAAKEAHHKALQEMREVLEIPMVEEYVDKEGKPQKKVNTKLISEKIKIFALLDNRVKGAILQKLAIRSQSEVALTMPKSNDPLTSLPLKDLESIDAHLASINYKLKSAGLLPQLREAQESKLIEVTLGAEKTEGD